MNTSRSKETVRCVICRRLFIQARSDAHATEHRNLYHWLLGDSAYHAGRQIYSLPFENNYDHPQTPQMEAWQIYWRLLEAVRTQRPLLLPWLQLTRPLRYSKRRRVLEHRGRTGKASPWPYASRRSDRRSVISGRLIPSSAERRRASASERCSTKVRAAVLQTRVLD